MEALATLEMPMLELRPSRLPLAVLCPQSLHTDGIAVESDDADARLGSATHEVLAARITAGQSVDGDVSAAATRWRVDHDDVGMLSGMAWQMWTSKLSAFFPEPLVEQPLEATDTDFDMRLKGTADVICFVAEESEVRGNDFKTGRVDWDYEAQQRAYALLGLIRWPEAKTARMTITWVRSGRAETFVWTRSDLADWWHSFAKSLQDAPYRAGSHCSKCLRAFTCQARTMALRQSVEVFEKIERTGFDVERYVSDLAITDPAQLAQLVAQARDLTKFLELTLESIKSQVIVAGGTLGALEVEEITQRPINLARAWEPLVAKLGQEKVIELSTISKTKVSDEIKAVAGRGRKGKDVTEFMDGLDGMGALDEKVIEKLIINRRFQDGTSSIAATDTGTTADATTSGNGDAEGI